MSASRWEKRKAVMAYHLLVKFDLLDLACPLQLLELLSPALLIFSTTLLRLFVLSPLNLEPLLLLRL
jgi:hypothetical protein